MGERGEGEVAGDEKGKEGGDERVAAKCEPGEHPLPRLLRAQSGFDLGARDTLYADAIRPQATPTGIRHLLGAAGGAFRLRHWRHNSAWSIRRRWRILLCN